MSNQLKSVTILYKEEKESEWNLDPSVNVLIGENGFGKSRLLRAIFHAIKDANPPCPSSGIKVVDGWEVDRDSNPETEIKISLNWENPSQTFATSTFVNPELQSGLFLNFDCELSDDLKTQVSFFAEVVSSVFLWGIGKSLELTPSGLSVLDKYKQKIEWQQLSSGERHLIFLLWQCFCAERHSVILIDTPEVFIHLGWQHRLIDGMKQLVFDDCQFIISTHAPGLIAKGWNDKVTKISSLFTLS